MQVATFFECAWHFRAHGCTPALGNLWPALLPLRQRQLAATLPPNLVDKQLVKGYILKVEASPATVVTATSGGMLLCAANQSETRVCQGPVCPDGVAKRVSGSDPSSCPFG
jgi:hypothetical protein